MSAFSVLECPESCSSSCCLSLHLFDHSVWGVILVSRKTYILNSRLQHHAACHILQSLTVCVSFAHTVVNTVVHTVIHTCTYSPLCISLLHLWLLNGTGGEPLHLLAALDEFRFVLSEKLAPCLSRQISSQIWLSFET